ncbi:MAG: hypothetical protein GX442_26100 [Candidatus Riflebacteria bacterium]|nr:hypothetical protein [Candidatus Riflebacteria bacterium]
MSFTDLLRWILGREQEPETPAAASPKEHRASPRLNFSQGVVQVQGVGDFPLVNLSQGGLALHTRDHPILARAPAGMVLPAKIRLGSVFFETDLKVVALEGGDVGCAFGTLPPAHSRALADFLKPRILGRSLREIDATALKATDPALRLRWFQGDEGTQLFCWTDGDEGPERMEFYFLDSLVSCEKRGRNLQTAYVRTQALGPVGPADRAAIAYHPAPSYRVLRLGRTIVEHSPLPAPIKNLLEDLLFREEKCSFSRVVMADRDRNVVFEMEARSGSLALPVVSLSSNSMTLLPPESLPLKDIAEGDVYQGMLRLPDRKLALTFKVLFRQDYLLGGGLKLIRPCDVEALSAFLAPRLLGKSLETLPPPAETRPFAPQGSRASLFVGIHNTHLLSLVVPPDRLVYGRLVLGDRAIVFDRNALTAYACPRGFIFPTEWDIATGSLERIPHDDPALLAAIHEVLQSARLPEEVRLSWTTALPTVPVPAESTPTKD